MGTDIAKTEALFIQFILVWYSSWHTALGDVTEVCVKNLKLNHKKYLDISEKMPLQVSLKEVKKCPTEPHLKRGRHRMSLQFSDSPLANIKPKSLTFCRSWTEDENKKNIRFRSKSCVNVHAQTE